MKNKWQKYVFSFCLGMGIIIGVLTHTAVPTIVISALLGIILHFFVRHFFPPAEVKEASKKAERVLTNKESARQERIDRITEDLEKQGYVRKDQIISIFYANVMALLLSIPFIFLFGVWFYLCNGRNFDFSLINYYLLCVELIILIIVHEGIHGLTWGLFAPGKFKTIEFGFMIEKLTPYCTCGDPLKKMHYILGSFMPCLVLGIIPCIIAVYVNSVYLLLLGIIMIMGAGGDLTIILKLLFYKESSSDIIIMDHPTECGFIIFER